MRQSVEDSCCVCEKRLQFGPGIYPGRPVPQWGGRIICRECERYNQDGIVITTHPELPGRIGAAGGKLTLNAEGHIVIPPLGSN